ncbi:SWI/SNF nucleosome remodeling complex component [Amphibalanus amphitrite]|uniref:SWI/SNF nucleosome remodeling complex component n=1 Tax=Amphibalanus amphitrite TaxID=1232801 RepID=A0A6A4W8Y6_AMPAM|nr:SWI/SNF nucleosome remodeling complex component [Amphibalanus amphitrite]
MPFIQPSQPTVLPKGPTSHLTGAPTENTLWTVKWLQTVCEISAGQSIEQGVLYKQYTASAAAQHWKGIITQGEFANCVKSVFGSAVTAVARRVPSGVTEYHFEGIRSKLQIVTTVVQQPTAVAAAPRPPPPVSAPAPAPAAPPPPPPPASSAPVTSSILKAQLSAPPRPEVLRAKEQLPPVSSQAVPSSPRLSQALLGGGPAPSASSSLIKSLLASKVAPSPPPPPTSVTVSSSSPAGGLSPSCFTTPQAQVARNMQNKRLAVNGVSENEPPTEQTPPPSDPAAAGDGAVHNGVKPSPPNSNSNSNAGCGEGLLADLLERKVAPVNGIDKELRIGDRGLELVNNNNGTGGGEGDEQPAGAVNGGAPPAKRNGTDLLASALDMAGLMDDLGAMDDDDPAPASPPPPPAPPTPPPAPAATAPQTPPQQPPAGQQGFKRPAEGVAGGEAKRLQLGAQPVALQSAVTAGGQQVVMVPQSMANMVLKLPANVSQGQQLLLPQGQLMMTSSGQLVLGQHQAQVMVQGAGTGNVVVGQPAVGQPQTVLVAQTPQQQGTATRTLIFLPPHQKVYVSQPGVTHQGQLMVQVTRAGGQTQVVNSTVVTGSRAAQQHLRGQPQPIVSAQPAAAVVRPAPSLLCEWRGCLRGFPTAYAVYQHAIEAHCPPQLTDIPCLWERCDGMIRKRYSMMTHLQDRHCPEQMLRLMRRRREQLQATGKTDIPTPSAPPPHPGYANNAALQAIRRHALSEVKPPPDEKEGPVTKSIRLTAALILRNIAVFSQHGRRVLRAHESHLLNIAASSAESSRTIGQLLADLHEADPS